MSKINIQGTIDNIRSKSNVYTPLIEAIVNSIDSIQKAKIKTGEVKVIIKRDSPGLFSDSENLPAIRHIEVHDNGTGFTKVNRDSFDTFYSDVKKDIGGKGFGRFLFLKYFNQVTVYSNYKETDGKYYVRTFSFGKKDEIIINEINKPSDNKKNSTIVSLANLFDNRNYDKELKTIARKVLEKLLIFFVNDKIPCPKIIIKDDSDKQQIVLNDYLKENKEIKILDSKTFEISENKSQTYQFTAKLFKIYYSTSENKVILTGHNREVTETTLHTYIPEFEDGFYDSFEDDFRETRKNYAIKVYVVGKYLNDHVSLEREAFNFDKERPTLGYELSQYEIEKQAAILTKSLFETEVKMRSEKKVSKIAEYVNSRAPWHKAYFKGIDFSTFAYNMTEERMEIELQKFKFHREQETRINLTMLLNDADQSEFDKHLNQIMSQVSEIGKSDLAHYVCSRKLVLQAMEALRQRSDNGKAKLEDEIHTLIYPMNADSENVPYEQHNLWLLDERLVFSEYVASDRKISKKKGAQDEPDLVVVHNSIFDVAQTFRSGENEFSNPLTIFEFKRPKRTNYTQDEDPILQIFKYLNKIRKGKYEMPKGIEPIKVNEFTPVYGYVICDLVDRVHDFARNHSLTLSPDQEGYFGFHSGYRMYIEVISYKKLLKDSTMRNKIFFKKLQLE
jgi:hypothetical protein